MYVKTCQIVCLLFVKYTSIKQFTGVFKKVTHVAQMFIEVACSILIDGISNKVFANL